MTDAELIVKYAELYQTTAALPLIKVMTELVAEVRHAADNAAQVQILKAQMNTA
jgi:hypothetical protein